MCTTHFFTTVMTTFMDNEGSHTGIHSSSSKLGDRSCLPVTETAVVRMAAEPGNCAWMRAYKPRIWQGSHRQTHRVFY